MADVGLSIIASECESACKGEPDLEKRVQKAMAVVAKGHWMYCNDDQDDLRFRGALGGVLLAPETTQAEKDRITGTLKQLRSLSALMQGVPVDTEAMLKEQEEHPPLPLVKWWHEAKAA